ncbi:phosphate uptake regulator PhoU [Candidatus Bathyarchaeota archaeon]|nr:phosphate uptake regulator PhoU [Candidatus Bathyarchaeota archaeon]
METSNEEIRKIQFTGKSTYIISLPKKWVTSRGLKAGSQLVVSQQNGSLILSPKEMAKSSLTPAEATIIISNKENSDTVTREIVSLYLVGYNFINVRTKDERINALHRNAIKELTRKKLVGTEIISESPNEMKLQILISYPELSMESALRRMCLIATSMHEDDIQALRDLNKELAKEVIQLDDEVDRFSLYIIRQLKAAVQNEKILKDIGLSSARDCLGYRVIVKSVERIADHAVKIAENITLLKEKPSEKVFQKISEMGLFARKVFEDSIKSLFKKDYLLADHAVYKAKTIVTLENEVIKEIRKKIEQVDVSNIRMIMESMRRTAEYASDIAEIVLNLNVNQILTK